MPKTDRKVWCFLGDGETDEPESLGAISVAGREGLDNLVFVINCNLQRLDGPVRGNGKIIQELEGGFRGAGWNVIKLIWGSYWDPLLARDTHGVLKKLMMETVDGEYQNCKAFGGAYTREHFFGKYPETQAMVANLSDDDIWRLNRGGHDPHKVYAAYHQAVQTKGMPTVILAKTVKGYGMGAAGEALNPTHQTKKLDDEAVRIFRDRFNIPVTDEQLKTAPCRSSTRARSRRKWNTCTSAAAPRRLPAAAPPQEQRNADRAEAGSVRPLAQEQRRPRDQHHDGVRAEPVDRAARQGSGPALRADRRGRSAHLRHGRHVPPAGHLRAARPEVQAGRPRPADVLPRRRRGQVLEEGITECGAFSSWMAAATSYSTNDLPMLPFYIYYSMFGFQRIGDSAGKAATCARAASCSAHRRAATCSIGERQAVSSEGRRV
jgi:pyruvate dehydrogenase E1 component